MGVIAKGIPRGYQGLFTPVSLGYPLSVFNKNATLQDDSVRVFCWGKAPDMVVPGGELGFSGPWYQEPAPTKTVDILHCGTLETTPILGRDLVSFERTEWNQV